MILHIASNLKRLRKERELTQEDLADFLGVSFQAVSKWERDEGYPDITMLPSIANFFEISLDDLIGMTEIKDESDIQEIKNQVTKNDNEGNFNKAVEILRDAVKRYPNNYDLLADLAFYLGIIKKHDEAIEISERILKFCTDQKIRSDVQCNVCFDYWRSGMTEKAAEEAKKLPNIYKTMENTLVKFISGKERVRVIHDAVQKLVWEFYYMFNLLTKEDEFSTDEKIELIKKSNQIYDIVYENHDHAFGLVRMLTNWQNMAEIAIDNERVDEAINYLDKAADMAIEHDNLPLAYHCTSLAIKSMEYNREWGEPTGGENYRELLLKDLESQDRYKPICENKDFIKIRNKLK